MKKKRVWISRDEVLDDVVCIWKARPFPDKKLRGTFKTKSEKGYINCFNLEDSNILFGNIEPGQCKPFDIVEVKE